MMKNLTNFNGRARRSELWWYYLLYAIMCIVASAVAMAFPYLLMTLSFILLLSVCAVTVRRLHDGGHSGLWVLASVLIGIASNIYCLNAGLLELTQTANPNPEDILKIYSDPVFMSLGLASFVVNIVILVFSLQDSKKEENKYGPSPKYVEKSPVM